MPFTILPPLANGANAQKFVFVQGYALFRISDMDSNDVKGYAVSPMYTDFNDVIQGLQPRLVPWN